MTRIQWIMEQNSDAESTIDYYKYFDDYCKEFPEVPFETYKRYCRQAFQELTMEQEEGIRTSTTGDSMTVTMKSSDIKTEEDLLKFGKIDLSKWEVVELTNEFWGNDDNPHYLIKGKYKLRSGALSPEEYLEVFNKSINTISKSKPMKAHTKGDLTHLISIPDLHNGKLINGTYVGHDYRDYSSEIATNLYSSAVQHFSNAINSEETKTIVFPFGEDYFNVDNMLMTTTKGTPQHNEDVYAMLENGISSVFGAIETLAEKANVFIPIISGNHDKLVSHLVGLMIAERYKNDNRISVDTLPHLEKVYSDGLFCVMLIHGNRMKTKDLAWRLAANHPTVWAQTKYREVFSGHYHRNSVTDEHGVRVSYLPSLSSISYWEDSHNYASLREAQMHSFHPKFGRVGTYYYSPNWYK